MTMSVFIALMLCISPYVPQRDADTFARVANARGYDVVYGMHTGCAATLFASDSDWADPWVMGYDDGELDGGRHKRLSSARAADILTAWEARLVP